MKYLKPNTVIEPLFDRWYAWSHLISPATAAMNIVGRHLKIMDSYVKSPQIHEEAVKHPKLKGGPFIDLPSDKLEAVKQLKKNTLEKHSDLIELSAAFKELDRLLMSKAKGFSLQPLYEEVPEILKGYVELVYDLNNQPSYRIFESLLINSSYYKESAQSIALWLTNNDERPFVLSTPKLDDKDTIHLNIPFSSNAIDMLSKMKQEKGDIAKVAKALGVKVENMELFETFFTDNIPVKYERYKGDKIRMRYYGHACILVETKDISILLDPVISYYGYSQEVDRFSDMHLPDEIDYVLITHNHQDHILFETLLPLRHRIKNIVVPKSTSGSIQDPNLRLMFNSVGFNNIVEIEDMMSIEFDDCKITGLPFIGEHCDLNIQSKICHHVQIGELSLLFAADSCNIQPELYKNIQKQIGDIDVIFLGMECDGAPLTWLYGPLLTEELDREKDQSRRLAGCNFGQGKALVDAFNPKEVYIYAMGAEPWLEYISSIKYTAESHPIVQSDKLIEYCKLNGISSERLFGEKEILYAFEKQVATVE